jgi:hypothetical protein
LFSQDFSRFSSATSPIDVADKNDEKAFDINDVADVAHKNRGEAKKTYTEAASGAPQTLRSSDGMPAYSGPVVPVPEPSEADRLDEHGAPWDQGTAVAQPAPKPTDGGTEPGLSPRTIRDLADAYQERTYAQYKENGSTEVDYRPIDAWLRQRLREEVAFPEHVEIEFERIMQAVFAI